MARRLFQQPRCLQWWTRKRCLRWLSLRKPKELPNTTGEISDADLGERIRVAWQTSLCAASASWKSSARILPSSDVECHWEIPRGVLICFMPTAVCAFNAKIIHFGPRARHWSLAKGCEACYVPTARRKLPLPLKPTAKSICFVV